MSRGVARRAGRGGEVSMVDIVAATRPQEEVEGGGSQRIGGCKDIDGRSMVYNYKILREFTNLEHMMFHLSCWISV